MKDKCGIYSVYHLADFNNLRLNRKTGSNRKKGIHLYCFMQSLSVFFCFCFCFFGDSFLFFLFYLVNVSREGRVFEVVLTVIGQMTYLGEERVVSGRELEVGREYTEL